MKKRILTVMCCALITASTAACGAVKSDFSLPGELIPSAELGISIPETLAGTDKPIGENNPIASNYFFADPTSVEYDGRLYVYGTSDQQEYDAKSGIGDNSYGSINTLACFSTADMVNWTYHGTIPVTEIATWAGCSWAPSIVSRERNGKTEFFLYFANSGGGVGVLTSDSPTGPWTDPIGGPLVAPNTNELASDPVCWCFDPGVCIDDNGVGWIAIGGGNPMHVDESDYMPGNCRLARLGEDMISLDSELVKIPAPYHFEANELNYINGTWALTYCTNWANRGIWPSNSEIPAPSVCSMAYMTSTDPLNPDSWEYRGEYLTNPNQHGYPTSNNHTHLQKFKDKYYILYQNVSLLENIGSSATGFRSIGVDVCEVDEDNVTFSPASMTDKGVDAVSTLDVFSVNQAETTYTTAGVKFYTLDGVTFVTSISDGDWTGVREADFKGGANAFAASVRGKGAIEIRLDSPEGKTVGKLEFDISGEQFKNVTVSLDRTVSGVHDLYFVFGGSFVFDSWQFAYLESEQ